MATFFLQFKLKWICIIKYCKNPFNNLITTRLLMSIYEYIKKTSVEKIKLEIVKETKLIAIEMIVAFKDVDQSVFVNSVIKI